MALGPASDFLRTDEAAKVLTVSAGTLAQWRRTNQGPPYFRLGPRTIVYQRADLEDWLKAQIARTYHEAGQ
jgi:predicted DNA-binding transcriptional regulator AlpA